MCGIAGIASARGVDDGPWLPATLAALRHRGPDGTGVWRDPSGRVAFAHRRLAIVDLSPTGRQPMLNAEGSLAITFNGEIYNFQDLREELAAKGAKFGSTSDTEVILAAYARWGPDLLSRLNGQFAFALYDAKEQRLLLARDRAGEKPLFYHFAGGTLRFASELKALLAEPSLPRRIDPEALDCYLGFGFVPGDRCILEGYHKLPPAHALVFDLATGTSRTWRYWQLPDLEGGPADEARLLDELESLLADAVRRQLVADVPVGVLLSGGVDSSLVTAMAARSASRVKTFTVRFPGHGKLDETEHARLVAKHFETDHVELDAPDSTAALLPELARQFDEPIVDSSMIPTFLLSREVRKHCTVALGGDGGDELFGGYTHYSRLLSLESKARWVPRPARAALATAAGAVLPVGTPGRNWLQAAGADLRAGVPHVATYFDHRTRRRLLAPRGPRRPLAETLFDARVPTGPDLLQRATRFDFTNYLPEDICVKVDRASMLSSLEVRAPMLDHRVVEFAFSRVPSRLKATRDRRKILLKRLAQRVLPAGFDLQRKQGFSIPLDDWMTTGPWRELTERTLLDGASLFDRRIVRSLLAGQSRGRRNGERLFGLALFELWRREYGVTA